MNIPDNLLNVENLAQQIHDRITSLSKNMGRDLLTWDELEKAGKPEYEYYLDNFEKVVRELIVEPLKQLQNNKPQEYSFFGTTMPQLLPACYLCNSIKHQIVKYNPPICSRCLKQNE